ncbi:MAG: hypothetical protein JF591_22660, partial [Lysobacter sp.]|nr:hypothetical protein [Lysobacter sp.]
MAPTITSSTALPLRHDGRATSVRNLTDSRERRDGKKQPPRSGTGREELRSTWFRPYLLRLRAERGEAALRALLSTAGIPIGQMNDDAGWLSVAAGKRLLRALA